MTAFSDLNTARVKIKVTGHTVAHTTKVRIGVNATENIALQAFGRMVDIYTIIAALLPTDFAVLGASWAPAGEAVYQPLNVSGYPDILGQKEVARRDAAKNWKLSGNDLYGNTTSIVLWYVDSPAEAASSNDYRLTGIEESAMASIFAALTTPTPIFTGASGQILKFKPYLNQAVSAYWQKELRK